MSLQDPFGPSIGVCRHSMTKLKLEGATGPNVTAMPARTGIGQLNSGSYSESMG